MISYECAELIVTLEQIKKQYMFRSLNWLIYALINILIQRKLSNSESNLERLLYTFFLDFS